MLEVGVEHIDGVSEYRPMAGEDRPGFDLLGVIPEQS